ncbi:MAG: hypothetical protein JNM18_12545 [Planctomycetaceae bacterium]|nr:hypothetical protein [Planctomycetaceae bacterium]
MARELSAQNEQYLGQLVRSGAFASRAAALNAAVEALKRQASDDLDLSLERLDSEETVTAAGDRNGSQPVDDAHWRRLDRLAEEVATVTTS